MDESNHHSGLAVYKGAIAVNQDGRRYVDESTSYKLLGDACMRQANAAAYRILDEDIFRSGDNRVRILDFERLLEDGLMVQAESLAQLAALIEIDPDVLARTVDEYNAAVDAGFDPDFGRRHLVHIHGALRRIERALFYASPSTAAVFGTYCGLCVNPGMRVLDVYGAVLPVPPGAAARHGRLGFHGAPIRCL